MTKKVTVIDTKEIPEIQIGCECGSALTLTVPLKKPLDKEHYCPGCDRALWLLGSPVHRLVSELLAALEHWTKLDQKLLKVSFVLTEKE